MNVKNILGYRRNEDGTIEFATLSEVNGVVYGSDGETIEPTGETVSLVGWNHANAMEYRDPNGSDVAYLIPKYQVTTKTHTTKRRGKKK